MAVNFVNISLRFREWEFNLAASGVHLSCFLFPTGLKSQAVVLFRAEILEVYLGALWLLISICRLILKMGIEGLTYWQLSLEQLTSLSHVRELVLDLRSRHQGGIK